MGIPISIECVLLEQPHCSLLYSGGSREPQVAVASHGLPQYLNEFSSSLDTAVSEVPDEEVLIPRHQGVVVEGVEGHHGIDPIRERIDYTLRSNLVLYDGSLVCVISCPELLPHRAVVGSKVGESQDITDLVPGVLQQHLTHQLFGPLCSINDLGVVEVDRPVAGQLQGLTQPLQGHSGAQFPSSSPQSHQRQHLLRITGAEDEGHVALRAPEVESTLARPCSRTQRATPQYGLGLHYPLLPGEVVLTQQHRTHVLQAVAIAVHLLLEWEQLLQDTHEEPMNLQGSPHFSAKEVVHVHQRLPRLVHTALPPHELLQTIELPLIEIEALLEGEGVELWGRLQLLIKLHPVLQHHVTLIF